MHCGWSDPKYLVAKFFLFRSLTLIPNFFSFVSCFTFFPVHYKVWIIMKGVIMIDLELLLNFHPKPREINWKISSSQFVFLFYTLFSFFSLFRVPAFFVHHLHDKLLIRFTLCRNRREFSLISPFRPFVSRLCLFLINSRSTIWLK